MKKRAKYSRKEVLDYHSKKKGKIEVKSKVKLENFKDLSMAYTPGVAEISDEIQKNSENISKYTNRDNMVAVVSDGTAVLGLGDIGPDAAFPVMSGKCVLFKEMVGIDAVPICLSSKGPEKIINAVSLLSKSFAGINLEDIAAPNCFKIESELKKRLDIPVFHDDQHGTAVVTLAALLNSLKIAGKKITEIKVAVSGAGAAAIACSNFYMSAGVKEIILSDSSGIIYEGRKENMNDYKKEIAERTNRENISGNLEDAMKGADVFLGLSAPNLVNEKMIKSMASNPIVFACANPKPEIMPENAVSAGAKIAASGRSDYPNQINNILGFPGIFRGALDSKATEINEEMKLAAAKSLASSIPEDKLNETNILPSPLDFNAMKSEAKAVAEAAVKSGVAPK